MISKSYPYLSISSYYNVPYDKVLSAAQEETRDGHISAGLCIELGGPVIRQIRESAAYFKDVRSGVMPFH